MCMRACVRACVCVHVSVANMPSQLLCESFCPFLSFLCNFFFFLSIKVLFQILYLKLILVLHRI